MRLTPICVLFLTGCASFAPVGNYPAYREAVIDAKFDGPPGVIRAIRTGDGYQIQAPAFTHDVNYLAAMGRIVMCILQARSCSESYVLYDPNAPIDAVDSREFTLIIDTDPDHRWQFCGANAAGCAVGSRIFIEPPKVIGQTAIFEIMGHEFMHIVAAGWHDDREAPYTAMDRFRQTGTWARDLSRANGK